MSKSEMQSVMIAALSAHHIDCIDDDPTSTRENWQPFTEWIAWVVEMAIEDSV